MVDVVTLPLGLNLAVVDVRVFAILEDDPTHTHSAIGRCDVGDHEAGVVTEVHG